ncbi:MAG: YccF domain-containing protein [Gaiellales bacterium]
MSEDSLPDQEAPKPIPVAAPADESVPAPSAPAVVTAEVAQTATTNVNVIVNSKAQHGFLLRALWYIAIGWWASGIVSGLAYLCIVTVVGIPAGFWLINRIPAVMTLRQRTRDIVGTVDDQGNVILTERHIAQHSLLLRALWFVVVGWWALLVWMSAAWFASITIVGIPLGIWMYNRTPWVATLQRN